MFSQEEPSVVQDSIESQEGISFGKINLPTPSRYIEKKLVKSRQKERVISDFIAGMTDRYAINLHKKIK